MTERRVLCPVHNMPDCSPLLNGCNRVNKIVALLDALELLAGEPVHPPKDEGAAAAIIESQHIAQEALDRWDGRR